MEQPDWWVERMQLWLKQKHMAAEAQRKIDEASAKSQ